MLAYFSLILRATPCRYDDAAMRHAHVCACYAFHAADRYVTRDAAAAPDSPSFHYADALFIYACALLTAFYNMIAYAFAIADAFRCHAILRFLRFSPFSA